MRSAAGLLLSLVAARAWGVAGPPPFDWAVTGPLADEREFAISVEADGGTGRGYAGGDAAQSLRARDFATAPVALRYGMPYRLEAFAVVPWIWAASDLSGRDLLSGATVAASVSGADLGDPGAGVRWGLGDAAEEGRALVLGLAAVAPLGWDPWRSRAYNLAGSGGASKQSFGDGAWKVLLTAEERRASPSFRASALAGVLAKFPVAYDVKETFLVGYGSSINVREPSVVLARIRAEWSIVEGWWAGCRAEGVWAGGGSLAAGGFLAADPALFRDTVGGYANLVKPGGAAWLGGGLAWDAGPAAIRLEALAPVAARRSYRYWRVGLAVSAGWIPPSN